MKNEIFLFSLPNGKTFKVFECGESGYEVWRKQPNNEFVYVETFLKMECVKDFFKSGGYNGY